jgi:hypothetical protein
MIYVPEHRMPRCAAMSYNMYLILAIYIASCPCITAQQHIEPVLRLDGDVTVAGLFTVSTAGEDGACGDIIPVSVQLVEAVRWVIQSLNDQNYVPGIKIGMSKYHIADAQVPVDNFILFTDINKFLEFNSYFAGQLFHTFAVIIVDTYPQIKCCQPQ